VGIVWKQLACASVKQSLVQILVVVATIQMRFLKTEVEKGSMTTAFGHGLVGPKDNEKSFDGGFTSCSERESGQYSRTMGKILRGNANELKDTMETLGKRCLRF
jgi:hypothetical protein